MIRLFLLVVLVAIGINGFSQTGGEGVYQFLDVPVTARLTALGGSQAGLADNDLNLLFGNPATLNDAMSRHLTFNVAPYMADITSGAVAYAHHLASMGTFAVGIRYMLYGSFIRTDEAGVELGTFKANDYALMVTWSRAFGPRWRGAFTLKPIVSHLENYQSFGLAVDAGVMYVTDDGLFSAGLILKNLGSQVTSYHNDDTPEALFPNLQAGFSIKPEHAPFRFSLGLNDLLSWNYRSGEYIGSGHRFAVDSDMSFGEKLARHAIVGIEFMPAKSFYVAAGYNHARRAALKGATKLGSSGFSWGAGFKVYKFHVAYGSARYHMGGRTNYFSLSTNFSSF